MVAESVTDNAASEPHSGSFFSWMTTTWPGSDFTSREIAKGAIAVRQRHVVDDALPDGSGRAVARC